MTPTPGPGYYAPVSRLLQPSAPNITIGRENLHKSHRNSLVGHIGDLTFVKAMPERGEVGPGSYDAFRPMGHFSSVDCRGGGGGNAYQFGRAERGE